jgi:hypothetical protein
LGIVNTITLLVIQGVRRARGALPSKKSIGRFYTHLLIFTGVLISEAVAEWRRLYTGRVRPSSPSGRAD